jgi:hypothetical protein
MIKHLGSRFIGYGEKERIHARVYRDSEGTYYDVEGLVPIEGCGSDLTGITVFETRIPKKQELEGILELLNKELENPRIRFSCLESQKRIDLLRELC